MTHNDRDLNRGQLLKRHAAFARMVARRQARGRNITCPHAIADLEQASLIGMDLAAQTWDRAHAFTTWAGWKCRAAVQAELRRLKGKGHRHQMPTIVELDEGTAATDPIVVLEARELVARINDVVQGLPDSWRVLFRRHYIEGVTATAIADESGVTRWAVCKKLHKIYARVEQELRT